MTTNEMKKVLLTMMAVVALTITSCCNNKAKETTCDKSNTECAAKHECKKACDKACEMPDSCKKACEKACDKACEKATCDKYELNRVILNYKKRFHEACSVLDGHEKPKRKER